jgi:uncharacterized membrane protein
LAQLTDRTLENSIARMLACGVIFSSIAVLAGGALYLRNAKVQIADYTHFHAASPSLRTVNGVLQGVSHLDAESIIQLGLLLLIATPVVRVIFCMVGFSRQRDKLYAVVSFAVLAILIYSLARGAQ